MTANAKSTRPAPSELPTLDDVESGKVTLEEYESAHGEDIPELSQEDFARARPASDFPELLAAVQEARRQPRTPELPVDVAAPVAVHFDRRDMHIELEDGRELVVPLTWYPDVDAATPARRMDFVLTATAVRWPGLEEEASIEFILRTQEKIAALRRASIKR